MSVLGIDTSNYTTSAALYHPERDTAQSEGRLLPVPSGQLGLRQSDAVFHHVRQLPDVLKALQLEGLTAIGVSSRPRAVEGSYMPCFLAGVSAADMLGQALGIPVYHLSHQQGHLAAAAWSSGHPELLQADFLAWHVSGGTTELLLVRSTLQEPCQATLLGGTKDLCAGQLIDRVGKMLELEFPAGPALEALSNRPHKELPASQPDTGLSFHLSGLQNKARQYLEDGQTPEAVAGFTIRAVLSCVENATRAARKLYPELPLLCAGGVMSNERIKAGMQERFGAYAAPPAYSRDNALGAAYLAQLAQQGR